MPVLWCPQLPASRVLSAIARDFPQKDNIMKQRQYDHPAECLGPYDRYVRIPSEGREPNTGFSRGFIYNLINTGTIRSALVPAPGRSKGGVRVFWLADAMAYIDRHLANPAPN